MTNWTIDDAREAYNIAHWGDGYFDINDAGHVMVRNRQLPEHPGVDLHTLAHELRDQGLSWPVLLRVTDILRHRRDKLFQSFERATSQQGYQGKYTAVYPIKVNQQRTVVEHLLADDQYIMGLEAGSKPELMAVLALAPGQGRTLICNGYKDREYIRLALIGRRLGYEIFLVVEKLSELELVIDESRKMGIEPLLGVRVRLASIGKGNWQNTGGEKSKFGLSAKQVLQMVERLQKENCLHWLQLIHCHLGSQLANIHDVQKGMGEVARFYSELCKLGAPIRKMDVGGGLGVDYEGTRSRSYCSINYSVQEYANDVVFALAQICQQQGLPHPDIISESGRAMTAHHALLISNVIDVERAPGLEQPTVPAADAPAVLHNLWESLQNIDKRSALEAYHDAVHWLSEAQTLFNHGLIALWDRAAAEQLYFCICRKVRPLLLTSSRSQREVLDELNEKLVDKYFCNLSIFQSVPDIWAIEQIFPIMPLQRLNEEPDTRAVLQDLTCDSDGSIDLYVDQQSVENSLRVHEIKPGEDYLLGLFMVGAYQEILGDMHNLFGDTHSINLEFTEDGGYLLSDPEQGDRVDEVLAFVHYEKETLLQAYRDKLAAVELDAATRAQYLAELEAGLTGYTYLED
ncbi:MAG: biosynthetic arginine decarboxylase [Gammaproteobacteria bacterium]|nr:biosynthetic arginine decarboxylase [Gammaproteobacteria bacterium]